MKIFRSLVWYMSTTVLALCVLLNATVKLPVVQAQAVFSDIDSARFSESIVYLANKGIVKGYPDGTFHPLSGVNRAELATILVSSLVDATTISGKKNCFTDVKNEWFAPYVCYAKEQGMVSGYPDGSFGPSKNVQMVEAYAMVIKRFGHTVPPNTGKNTPWYLGVQKIAHNNTVFSKFTYAPDRNMTRQEMAKLMHDFFLIADNGGVLSEMRRNYSAGCEKNPPITPPTTSTVKGVSRSYITVIPSTYNKSQPMPFVLAFHGRTNSNAEVRRYYGVEQAAQGKAIFVYPSGIKNGSNYSWSNPGDPSDNLRDFALFDQLVSEFSQKYCLDLDQIYVVGHSLGAWFTNTLACARGDVIRAIGSVGGGTTINNCSGPTAALIMHNKKDNLAPFSTGVAARDQLISQNECGQATIPSEPTQYFCKAYQSCISGAPVVWCEHQENTAYWDGSYYPHTWPKNAGREIWKFFQNLPK